MRLNAKRQRFFTLIELLAVIAVIAILAGIVLAVNRIAVHKKAEAKTRAQITSLEVALAQYKIEWGYFPLAAGGGALTKLNLESVKDRAGKTLYDPSLYEFKGDPGSSDPNLHYAQDGFTHSGAEMEDAFGISAPPLSDDEATRQRAEKDALEYRCPGIRNPQTYDLCSKGEKLTDDSDDISNYGR